jgi:aminopeptidase N
MNTDDEIERSRRLQQVMGVMYFFNWSGNRVAAPSWFDLDLKEGLTPAGSPVLPKPPENIP